VSVARAPSERMRRLAREAVAFSVAGLSSTGLDFLIFNWLIFLGPLEANLVSAVIATTLSFEMNRRWTYPNRPRTALHRELVMFFAVNLVGLGIQEIVLAIGQFGLGFDVQDDRVALNLFKLGGISAAMVFRFWAYRTLVFRKHQPSPATAAVLAATPAVPVDEELAAFGWQVPANIELPAELSHQRYSVR
jgi:putative flippase GtrA